MDPWHLVGSSQQMKLMLCDPAVRRRSFSVLCLAGQSLNVRISLSQLYGSSMAVSVVCQAVCHMAMTRALFCRDLLILQKLYLRFGDNVCVRAHTHTHSSYCAVSDRNTKIRKSFLSSTW